MLNIKECYYLQETHKYIYLCDVKKLEKMSKEKKITIKPFLNTRIAPMIIPQGEEEFHYYPLYYLIRYDRNNTQIAASNAFGGKNPAYLFKELGAGERDFYSNRTIDSIIQRDTHIIELIIRYSVNNNGEFELKGIKDMITDYGNNIFSILNVKMKDYMRDQLYKSKQFKWITIINFNRTDNSFYFAFTLLQKLTNVLEVFSPEDLRRLQTLKAFFEIYQKANKSLPDGINSHEDNILGMNKDETKYSKIQWLSGKMDTELETLITQQKSELSSDAIIETINWLMNVKTRQYT